MAGLLGGLFDSRLVLRIILDLGAKRPAEAGAAPVRHIQVIGGCRKGRNCHCRRHRHSDGKMRNALDLIFHVIVQ